MTADGDIAGSWRQSRAEGAKTTTWRLVNTGALPGGINMSLDAAILSLHAAGRSLPTLHVYGWTPIAVSLGHNQQARRAVDLEACASDGLHVVRRPTGGKAILHLGDFTFSLIGGAGEGIPRGIKDSYVGLSRVVRSAFSLLGVKLDAGNRSRPLASRHACFSSSTVADLTHDGRKLVGAAQRWEGESVLQQHSVLVSPDGRATFGYILPPPGQTREQAEADFAAATCGLAEALGEAPDRRQLVDALAAAVSKEFGALVEEGELSDEERSLSQKLRRRHELDATRATAVSGGRVNP